ncbi:hypothetical protein BHM03_00046416 [Ensete ventricosum]|nr:hypothetical protein BHM03_00046416 [Ensete ventricosum]
MVWSSPGGEGRGEESMAGPSPSRGVHLDCFISLKEGLFLRELKPAAGPAVPPSAAAALSISSLTHRLETYFRSNERGQRMAAAPAAGGDSCEEQRRVGPAGHSAPPLVASRGARRSPPSRRQ